MVERGGGGGPLFALRIKLRLGKGIGVGGMFGAGNDDQKRAAPDLPGPLPAKRLRF